MQWLCKAPINSDITSHRSPCDVWSKLSDWIWNLVIYQQMQLILLRLSKKVVICDPSQCICQLDILLRQLDLWLRKRLHYILNQTHNTVTVPSVYRLVFGYVQFRNLCSNDAKRLQSAVNRLQSNLQVVNQELCLERTRFDHIVSRRAKRYLSSSAHRRSASGEHLQNGEHQPVLIQLSSFWRVGTAQVRIWMPELCFHYSNRKQTCVLRPHQRDVQCSCHVQGRGKSGTITNCDGNSNWVSAHQKNRQHQLWNTQRLEGQLAVSNKTRRSQTE